MEDHCMDNEGESNHLQLADNPHATTNRSTFLTPCSGNRNIPMSQSNQNNIVTPPESSIAPVTTRLTETPKKYVPSNGPPDCLDLSTDNSDEDVDRKKTPEITEIDEDGEGSDAGRGTAIEDKMSPSLGKNGGTARVDWKKRTDSEIICGTVYGPDVCSYELAKVGGSGHGCIFYDKIKTLNSGIWLNDEVVDFMNGLLMRNLRDTCLLQEPDQGSYFIFPTQFMNRLMNKEGEVRDGLYTFENVRYFTSSKRKDMDIFALDKVFVSINYGSVYWYYATIDMKKKTIEMHNSSETGSDQASIDMKHLWHYLWDEHDRRHNGGTQQVLGQWKFIQNQPLKTPQQRNSKFYVLFLINQKDSLL